MYYHGSKSKDIKILHPYLSLHDEKYVYLTSNKAVALIYTANAIEVFYTKNNLVNSEKFQAWYSYSFDNDIPVLEEYYPNAIFETYNNQTGYIYECESPNTFDNPTNIKCAIVTKDNVKTTKEIHVQNIYEEILKMEQLGLLKIRKFEDMPKNYLNRIYSLIQEDIVKYDLINNPSHNYCVFLKSKFPFLF